jgi:SAM-dependent methyltransferase
MMAGAAPSSDQIAAAYDALAAHYDDEVTHTAWMRTELRRHYLGVFRPGDHILDVGCGTGAEALFLAGRGMRVTAMDLSPGMIAEVERKAAEGGLQDRIHPVVADIRDLDRWPAATFHGVISTFASLNMVNSLAGFSASAARLLRPGGRMILHLSNRCCLQERLALIGRGQWRAARRLGWEGTRVFSMRGRPMQIYLSSPDETYSWFFASHFELAGVYALGVVRPYADAGWAPAAVLSGLGWLERWVRGHRPFVRLGRFFVLELVRREVGDLLPQRPYSRESRDSRST